MESKESVLMQRYVWGKLLGQGTFAKVYHGRDIKNGSSVAIKILDKEKILKVGMMEQIMREISVMRLVRHPNVVQLYEVMASKAKIYIVMEYVKGGELFNKVSKKKMKEDTARKYFRQLISAVDFCHSRGVYHRDLKPENLLVDENGDLKVSDFGLSAFAESKQQDGLLHTTCGTPAYAAPEVINRSGYDGCKSDIWSCGVILFVLLAGYLPFHEANLMDMYRKIGKAEYKFPSWVSPGSRRLISKILDPNPDTRISISKIMGRSWYRKGLKSRVSRGEADTMNESDEAFTDADAKADLAKPVNLNAFEIISLSAGFDLSGLFEEKDVMKEVRFTSNQGAKNIVSKLEEIGKRLMMKVGKKGGGFLKFDGSKEGRKGVLSIDAEIFEISPMFHLVEMKKANGDTLEYEKVMKQEIRPALKDIVWTWQGDEAPLQQAS
ncbi:hypothetical protein ACS0TY_015355 [Phlomoides rotata]